MGSEIGETICNEERRKVNQIAVLPVDAGKCWSDSSRGDKWYLERRE
jgi:hypothetical protein